MSTIQHTLTTGTRIDCYEIGQVLGVGGFGITYKGYDHTLSCDVAIKEYLPSGVALRAGDGVTVAPKSRQDQDFYSYGLDRFLEEARILAKFRERSIVRVSRYLEGNGTAYLVMDYEHGQPLDAYMKMCDAVTEERILSILMPLLVGLTEVHGKGYLHRDIKPANIYLREDGSPVLLDFGAARQSMSDQTQAVTSMVTPGYAPIEQYNTTGKQGPWTDLYGLGATLYRYIVGQNPIGAPDRVMALQAGEPDPLLAATIAAKGQYSDELLQTVDWMLRPNIADRPQDVDAVQERLLAGKTARVSGNGPEISAALSPRVEDGQCRSMRWQQDDLDIITEALAIQLGPMAQVMVREVSAEVEDLGQLYERLATGIPSADGRQAFLESGARRLREADSMRLTGSPASRSSRRPTAPRSGITGHPVAITDELIARAEEQLAAYIGPLAKMIVRRTVGNCSNAGQLVERLADEIDAESDRRQFKASMER